MLGILGTNASLLNDIALIVQIAILFILLRGYMYKRAKKFRSHGLTMATAVLLHTVVILLAMVPSLIKNLGALGNITNIGVIITVIHAGLGLLAVSLGFFLVFNWRFRSSYIACTKRKSIMYPLLITWVSALVFGILFYGYYYL